MVTWSQHHRGWINKMLTFPATTISWKIFISMFSKKVKILSMLTIIQLHNDYFYNYNFPAEEIDVVHKVFASILLTIWAKISEKLPISFPWEEVFYCSTVFAGQCSYWRFKWENHSCLQAIPVALYPSSFAVTCLSEIGSGCHKILWSWERMGI